MKIFPALLMLHLLISVGFAAPDKFEIVIDRQEVKDGLIIGTISVNGAVIGNAYENADLKIPADTYRGVLRYGSTNNFVQGPNGKLGVAGDFLLEVANVKGRTDILFHSGNKPIHSKGCIMLGPATKKKGEMPVAPPPLQELRRLFYGTDHPDSTPNKQITIQIKSSLPQ